MPELPEVETIKSSLEKRIVGQTIMSWQQLRDSLRYSLAPGIAAKCQGARVRKVHRVAKYLVIELDNGNSLIFHLGMSGRLVLHPAAYSRQKHDHIVIDLDNGGQIVFNDPRRFGMAYICQHSELKAQKYMVNMGPDPFSTEFNASSLARCFKNKKTAIKQALMDNRIVTGVGNIYASESLFRSRIHPLTPTHTLSLAHLTALVRSVIFVLQEAIKAGGTSLKDFVNSTGEPGLFAQNLQVYNREHAPCYLCETAITRIVQGGRATYFCPKCQSKDDDSCAQDNLLPISS